MIYRLNRVFCVSPDWLNQYRLYGAAHYSLGSKYLWEFLVLNLKSAIDIGIDDYTRSTPE